MTTRKFKEKVLVIGFFLLNVAVIVIFVVRAWKSRTSPRSASRLSDIQQ